MKLTKLTLIIVLMISVTGIVAAQSSGDVAAKNKQIEAQNAAMQKAVNDGAAAFTKKDYAAAIDIYQKAYSADSTHPTVPILLKNIAAVKLQRGIETFNAGVKAGDETLMSKSKADLLDGEYMCIRAIMSAKNNNYAPDKLAPINEVQKQIFQKISSVFFYIGSVNSDDQALQKSADAAKAFLAIAAANDPNRTETQQILAELKSSYNIVAK
ncbi:MAG: hypothetical protein ABL952_09185 [Pyrinomonadaceae bacterium]